MKNLLYSQDSVLLLKRWVSLQRVLFLKAESFFQSWAYESVCQAQSIYLRYSQSIQLKFSYPENWSNYVLLLEFNLDFRNTKLMKISNSLIFFDWSDNVANGARWVNVFVGIACFADANSDSSVGKYTFVPDTCTRFRFRNIKSEIFAIGTHIIPVASYILICWVV